MGFIRRTGVPRLGGVLAKAAIEPGHEMLG
jgi:hypothetical protein